MRLFTFCAAFASWALAQHTAAATIEVRPLESGSSVIIIDGDIVKGDAAKFKRLAATIDDAVVAVESEGGATIEAIEIGEAIRLKGFSTLAVNRSTCTSACGLIWLAGSPRVITTTARVGFHATYSDKSGSRMESGVGNALVGRYLGVLNLPQKAIIFATSAPPESLNWLTSDNASSYGIDVKVIEDFEGDRPETPSKLAKSERLNIAPMPPPIETRPNTPLRIPPPRQAPVETTLWSRSTDWTIIVDHTLDNSCLMIRTFADGTAFRIGLDMKNGGKHYFMMGNTNWTSLKIDQTYPITIQFDNEVEWEADAVGVPMGNLTALMSNFEDNSFWVELASARKVTFSRNGKAFGQYALGDSSAAVDKVIACQKAENKKRDTRDPFAR